MQDVLRAISEMDTKDLNSVVDAVKDRRKVLSALKGQEALATVKIGDLVALQGLSPQYINGSRGVVERISGTKIEVLLNDTWAEARTRQRYGATITVPAATVRVVEQAV